MKRKNLHRGRTLKRSLGLQTLECRQVLAASMGWDGPGQGATALTYHISGQAGGLSQQQTTAAIEKALAAWSNVANITFTPTTQTGLKNSLDISFEKIDGVGGTLAQAYFPKDVNPEPLAGNVQFDSSESWEVGNAAGSSAVDLVYVAIHEIGHALGLDHSDNPSSVMYPTVSPTQSFVSLSSTDVSDIQKLYGTSTSSTTGTGSNNTDSSNTSQDDLVSATNPDTADTTPFPKSRWHRHGNWHHWGDRVEFTAPEHNYALPSDVNLDDLITALDALLIINQLSNSDSTSSTDTTDLINRCDTSGDGLVSAIDALRVINSLSRSHVNGTTSVSPISTPNPDPADDTSTDTTDTTDTSTDTTDSSGSDTSGTGNSDNTDTPAGDNSSPTDSSNDSSGTDSSGTDTIDSNPDGTNGSTDPVNDDTDSTGDDTDTTDDGTDSTGDDTDTTDDGTNDGTDTSDETADEHDCMNPDGSVDHAGPDGLHSHPQHFGHHSPQFNGPMLAGFLGPSAEDFVSRFDTSADGNLTEDELPANLWNKLVSLNADGNDDSILSIDEIDVVITSMMKSQFEKRDDNSDGALTADEVGDRLWASLGTADTDASESVSFEEFKTWLQNQPDDTDSGNDGQEDDIDQEAMAHTHHGRHFLVPTSDLMSVVGRSVSTPTSGNSVVAQLLAVFTGRRQ